MKIQSGTIKGLSVVLLFLGSSTGSAAQSSQQKRILTVRPNQAAVQFYDMATGNLLKELPTLRLPHEVVIDRQRGLAYVSITYRAGGYNNYETPSNEFQIVDLDKMEIIDTFDVSPHWAPHGMALDPRSGLLYVTCESNGGELIAVDMKQKKVVGSAKVDAHGPHWVAILPSGDKAYTANKETPHISVIDLKEMKMVKKIPAPTGTEGIIATQDGKYVFAGVQKGNDLIVIDPARDEVVKPISFDQPPYSFALSPNGGKLYVTLFNRDATRDGSVQEVDLTTLQPGAKVAVGRFPIGMIITADGKTGIVSSLHGDSLSILDLSEMKVARTIKTGNRSHGVIVF